MEKPRIKVDAVTAKPSKNSNSRRKFLKMGGLAMAGSGLLLYGATMTI